MKKSGFKGRMRFTLVELLVVIAIIAILAAMLLPALKGAKDMANGKVCLNNLKQVDLAIRMYADDCNGWFPPTPAANNYAFPWITLTQMGYIKTADCTSKWSAPSGILKCPSDPNLGGTVSIWNKTGLYWCGSQYGLMSYLTYDTDNTYGNKRWLQIDKVRRPSDIFMVGDTYCTGATYLSPALKHIRSWNVICVDGHAETLNNTATYASGPRWVP